jgi:outer membrane protein assembly factor BamA
VFYVRENIAAHGGHEPPQPQSPPNKTDTEKTAKVGNILVVGNTKTRTTAILKKMQLFPGQPLDEKALRKAEERLAPMQAIITVLESHDSGWQDILVTVKEK